MEIKNRFDVIEEEFEKMKKENFILHEAQQKLSRDIIIAITLIMIVIIVLIWNIVNMSNSIKDLTIGAMNMEDDYKTVETRLNNLENNN